MGIVVRRFSREDFSDWDDLVAPSVNGTFLHTRRFLSYHGERFEDCSLVIEDTNGRCRGVFPAALDPVNSNDVISHPGITYGGIVHDGSLRGSKMLKAVEAISEHYKAAGMRTLKYKAVPYIYHKVPSQDDLYAFFRLGAERYRCDLSACIDLRNRPAPRKRRRRQLKKATKEGIIVAEGISHIERFWPILEWNRKERYRTKPVHSLEEMEHLCSMFPSNIECYAAYLDGEVVAGAIVFNMELVMHVQYPAANAVGFRTGAQDAVMEHCIVKGKSNNKRYFDFGTSNTNAGTILNDSLHQYKVEFGAGGVSYEFYELKLA